MKRLRVFLIQLLAASVMMVWLVPVTAAAPSVSTHAQASALIDVTSGRILYSHNGDKKMRIASLTKIMTAIVAIEAGSLSDKVKVGINAYGVEGSSIYLRLGEEMSLHHLLYGLMLRSGNDAATAIAEHVGGSLDGFVTMMNEKAEQLGMVNTTFKNPHGLDQDGHLSSANDMAVLTAYALQNPTFREIVKTKSIKVPNAYENWDHLWRNKNKMLHLYDGADGVKTGYTKTAKRTLVSSATRGGQQLAAVTLNDGNDWADHAKLLDFGFQHYPLRVFYQSGNRLEGTAYMSPYSFAYPLTDEEYAQIKMEINAEPEISLAARLGVKAHAEYRLDGKLIGRLALYEAGHPILSGQQSSLYDTFGATAQADALIQDHPLAMLKRLVVGLFTVIA